MSDEELLQEFSFVATMIANTLATYEMQMGFDMKNKQLVLFKNGKVGRIPFEKINKYINEIGEWRINENY